MSDLTHGPEVSPGFLMWRATLRWQRLMTEVLGPLNLTHVQFVLLASAWWLSRDGGEAPNQLAVATHAGTNVKMTSEVMRKLEDKGLVVQLADPHDRRAKAVTVTPEGIRLAEQAVTVVEAADRDFFRATPGIVGPLRLLASFPGGG